MSKNFYNKLFTTSLKGMVAIAILLFFGLANHADSKKNQEPIYMFGFAASFNDSTVYFTEIQRMDSAILVNKKYFLYGRDNYSYQLRDYLGAKGVKTPTCVTMFGKNHADAEKKYVRMKKKYVQGGRYTVKYLSTQDFSFSVVKEDND